MDQLTVFRLFLFLHVIGAIVAFGPGFAAAVAGAMVAREPQHANFFARTQLAVGTRLVTPAALSMAITGILMIAVLGWSAIVGSQAVAAGRPIVLYIIAIVFAVAVQTPAGRKLVDLTATPPAPGSPPPPELPATAKRVRNGGMFLSTLVVIIVFLMVVKPF